MDADRKLTFAKNAIEFIAFSHDDGEVAVKAHLQHLREHIDACEARRPAELAAHVARLKAHEDKKEAARKAREEAAAKAAA